MRGFSKAIITGNLTRDPELRNTPNGASVCSFQSQSTAPLRIPTVTKRKTFPTSIALLGVASAK